MNGIRCTLQNAIVRQCPVVPPSVSVLFKPLERRVRLQDLFAGSAINGEPGDPSTRSFRAAASAVRLSALSFQTPTAAIAPKTLTGFIQKNRRHHEKSW